MRQFFLFLALICVSYSAHAGLIRGTLKEGDQGLAFANVMLYQVKDSSLVKFTYTEGNGDFLFENVSPGEYFVKATYVGLQDYNTGSITVSNADTDLGTIPMAAHASHLTEVTITASRPLLEVKPDKMVVNVAGSVLSTGDDALSLLRKSPGVLVDNNENITLMGKSGVVIYIDGKPSPLTATELANMLKTMSSNDIESIEIITNPSARYEAQGTAGIINIKRKKNRNAGLNGNASVTLRQGKTFGMNAGTGLNYRNEKLSAGGNATWFNSNNFNYMDLYREQNDLGFETANSNNNNDKGLNSKVTADYYLSKKSTLGLIAEYNFYDFRMDNVSVTRLGDTGLRRTDSLLVNNGLNTANTKNTNLNVNYYYDRGNETTFNVDANYGHFYRNNFAYTPNRYTTPDGGEVTSMFEVSTRSPASIDISSLKMDFERKLGQGKISAGVKSALVKTDNTFNFFNISDNAEVLNISLSNRFKYDEWVNAAYANYNVQVKKFGLNAGLRVENSNTKGDLTASDPVNDKLVTRHYTNVFPSAGISWAMSDKHNFQLSYGRRINRPNYQDLNPFQFQLDQLTYEKGNPFLNPEYTDNVQLVHTFKQMINTTLSYSHTDNVITRLVDTSGVKGSYITWDNIAYRRTWSAGMSIPWQISDKWSTFTNLNGVHTRNRADFGGGKAINLNVTSFNMYHQQTFKFASGWNAEVSGWYTSPSVWEGTFVMRQMWAAGAGVSKKFSDKARLTVNIDDIFKTNRWNGESTFGGLYMNVSGGWDSRRVRVTFSYNFGSQGSSKTRNRSTGSEDEQNRIKKS